MNLKTMLLLAGAALGLTSWTRADNNTFNYQGKLNDDCCPANGFYDVRFTLCKSSSASDVVPSLQPVIHLLFVTNGLFSTNLNFGTGSSIFDGSPRWLSLEVRNAGVGSFVPLHPLTEISRTPEAIFAQKAGSVANGAIQTASIAPGQVVKKINLLTDTVQVVSGDNNVHVDTDRVNGLIKISSDGGVFSLNGSSAYYNNGKVGIGTSTPQAPLDVVGMVQAVAGAGPAVNATASSGNALVGTAVTGNGVQGISSSPSAAGLYGESQGQGYGVAGRATGAGTAVWGDNGSPNGWAGFFSGRVGVQDSIGIGTRIPLGRLEIQAGAGWDGAGDAKAVALSWSGGGFRHFIRSRHNGSDPFNNAIDFYVNSATTPGGSTAPGVGNTLALSLNGGKVGIGTLQPSKNLEVQGAGDVEIGLKSKDAGGRLWTIQSSGDGVGDVGKFQIIDRTAVASRLSILDNGSVGIGTTTPAAKLDVADGDIHLYAGHSISSSGRLHIQANEDLYLNPFGGAGTVYVGGGGGPGNFYTIGSASVCSLTIRGGCDLAEPFQMSDNEIPKGSLVIIDEANEGKLKLAGREYDTRVAGIVSGANGVNPGISLHQEGVIEGGQNVALSGRVYALADASNGSIKPGDLLTSSSTPGHVMKVADPAKAQGSIVGKAMSALKEGKGMVLVLVSLQ